MSNFIFGILVGAALPFILFFVVDWFSGLKCDDFARNEVFDLRQKLRLHLEDKKVHKNAKKAG